MSKRYRGPSRWLKKLLKKRPFHEANQRIPKAGMLISFLLSLNSQAYPLFYILGTEDIPSILSSPTSFGTRMSPLKVDVSIFRRSLKTQEGYTYVEDFGQIRLAFRQWFISSMFERTGFPDFRFVEVIIDSEGNISIGDTTTLDDRGIAVEIGTLIPVGNISLGLSVKGLRVLKPEKIGYNRYEFRGDSIVEIKKTGVNTSYSVNIAIMMHLQGLNAYLGFDNILRSRLDYVIYRNARVRFVSELPPILNMMADYKIPVGILKQRLLNLLAQESKERYIYYLTDSTQLYFSGIKLFCVSVGLHFGAALGPMKTHGFSM